MRCSKCQNTGWIETHHGGSASWTPSLAQCPNQCSIKGYSQEVMRRLNNPKHVTVRPVLQEVMSSGPMAKLIPFVRREDRDDAS